MGWRALGDSAWLFVATAHDRQGKFAQIMQLKHQLDAARIPQLRDIVSSFESLAVHFDPMHGRSVLEWLKSFNVPNENADPETPTRIIEIPVRYGEDLEEIAARLELSPDDVISLHSETLYRVAAIGFSPGFPYLVGLHDALRLPRHDSPRMVKAGSVAIAGDQAGIYPFASQGGWHVLGHTEVELFDPKKNPPTLLQAGDRVRFLPIDDLKSRISILDKATDSSNAAVEIIDAGPFTSVQDLGRAGHQGIGVSPGGAMDPIAARVANLLLGNPEDHAVLECAMSGPRLRFHRACRVAFIGWSDSHDGRPIELPAGGEIDLRTKTLGSYAYIAFAGGIDVPVMLGSRSTDLRAGFGGHSGRRLKNGDLLNIGNDHGGSKPGDWCVSWPFDQGGKQSFVLRFIRGMQADWFNDASLESFKKSPYLISPKSDRVGIRLDGPKMTRLHADEMVSQPIVHGSVQVPPDGNPIVLMSECQTIGGYPQIGHVISADLPKLSRLTPGSTIHFCEVTLDEAIDAWNELNKDLRMLRIGLEFRK